jgi:homoserine/homoserine lactone efflux protein
MIDLGLYVGFVGAVSLLMVMPGPNVALIVANAMAYGPRYGLITVAGTSAAIVVQLGVTALGLTELLGMLGAWFDWIRWAGVVYLVYLGIAAWRAPVVDLTRTAPEPRSYRAIFGRGLLVSLSNPKTLFFYGAFFPQFLDPAVAILPQVLLLSATFLALAVLIDGSWALLAAKARFLLAARGRLRNRLSGLLLLGAGLGLALVRRSPN